MAEKTDNQEQIREEIKSLFAESLLTNNSDLDDVKKMQDTETVKIIIHELLAIKQHLGSTTNLTTTQVHGVTKLKTLNKIFKSPLIDQYAFSVMELKRSETKEPFNMLRGFFDLASNASRQNDMLNNPSILDKFLGKKGKM